MTATANRALVIFVSVACLLVGIGWWQLRLNRIKIERDLASVVAENKKITTEVNRGESKTGKWETTTGSETRVSDGASWQEPLRVLCKQLNDSRAENPGPHFVRLPSGPSGQVFKELMDNPEYARLATLIMRAEIQRERLQTLRWMGVPADKQEKLVALITEMGFARNDAEIAGKKYGVADLDVTPMVWSTAAEINHEMQTLLGDGIYDRWKQAEQARGARELIEGFETRLSYSTTSMTETQRQQLFGLLVKAKVGFMIQQAQLDPVIEAAHGFLSADQLVILKQVGNEYNLGKRIE